MTALRDWTEEQLQAELKKRYEEVITEEMTVAEAQSARVRAWKVFRMQWNFDLTREEAEEVVRVLP